MNPLAPGLIQSCADTSRALLTETALRTAQEGDRPEQRWLPQSLSKGAAGIAVAHAVRDDIGQAHRWLGHAVAGDVTVGNGSGLWLGAPAVAYAATIADPVRYGRMLGRLDSAIARLIRARLDAAATRMTAGDRPRLAEFDLVNGLTGLGAYLLSRDRNNPLLRDVLTYLVRLSAPIPAADGGTDLPGWWSDDTPSVRSLIKGHANLGVAHGIAGPLALLSLAARHDITVPAQTTAIDRITAWLDSWQQSGPTGVWWPKYLSLAELRAGRPLRTDPGRPSWCYGTPGISRALQLAAIARGDQARQQTAEQALIRCVTDPAQLAQLIDPYLCHGWAGMAVTVWYAAQDARTDELTNVVPHLTATLLDAVRSPADQPHGLIGGVAGIAAALHTMTAGPTRPWATCLLLA